MYKEKKIVKNYIMVKKQKPLIITLVSIIILLSMISIVSIFYNFIGGFYKSRVTKFAKVLGEQQTIFVDGVGAFCSACNFSGTILLDDDISQNIYIKTTNLQQDVNLRAKIEVIGYEDKRCDMFGYTNWITQEDDEYIYFNQTVGANEQIGLCKYVRLNGEMQLESNIDYVLIFVVEAY